MTWKETFSGRRFDLLKPDPASVYLPDIAHSLATQVRFAGHTVEPYTVAEHSLWVWAALARIDPRDYLLQLHGLLHDATEAYTCDITAPVKVAVRLICEPAGLDPIGFLESTARGAIYDHFNLPSPTAAEHRAVKQADLRMLVTERRALLPNTGREPWDTDYIEPYTELLSRDVGLIPSVMTGTPATALLPDYITFPVYATARTSRSRPIDRGELALLFRRTVERLLVEVRASR